MLDLRRPLPGALSLALLLLCVVCAPALARDIDVRSVSSRIEADLFVLDAFLAVRLNDRTREALDNGVALQFTFETRLLKPRRMWWDQELVHTTHRFLLSRHALADGYLLIDIDTEHQRSYKHLEDALQALGTFTNFKAGIVHDAQPSGRYRGRLRLRLDIEALPAPLRPVAYVSPSWRLSSGWYEWTFAR